MSPLALALFSARGLHVRHRRRYGIATDFHHCSPRCWRHGCCWQRLMERPC